MKRPEHASALAERDHVESRRRLLKGLGLSLFFTLFCILASGALIACGGAQTTSLPPSPSSNASPTQDEASADIGARAHSEARAREIFQRIEELARARVKEPPLGPPPPIPEDLMGIDFDTYRSLEFNYDHALFRETDNYIELQLFHRGHYYGRDVAIHLHHEDGTSEELPFDPARFNYEGSLRDLPVDDLGYAGFRLHAPINRGDYHDEFIVFLGASYFRGIGRGHAYGLSGRCYAIDTGLEGPEEFPEITALHLVRPGPNETSAFIIAEVRSERSEAAFFFEVTPGDETVLDVEGVIFLREEVEQLGLAPLTSMYLFGEDRPGRFSDYRPEIHDSDGLLLHSAKGERLFRRLRNPRETTLSSFRLDHPQGFGLLQRDRAPMSYLDDHDLYERRPSGYIEAIEGFEEGAVRLFEFSTELESDDNITAFFVPDEVKPETRVKYRVRFLSDEPLPDAGFRVARYRRGLPKSNFKPILDGSQLVVIDWEGGDLGAIDELEPMVTANGATIEGAKLIAVPELDALRMEFIVRFESERPAELRAFIRQGESARSETFSYLIEPGFEDAN